MFLEILLAILLGVLAGCFTGLIPGVHVNLVCAVLVSFGVFFSGFGLLVVAFIVALATTHTFISALPSIFLGAPDSSMVLSVLPGHALLSEGRGIEALRLTQVGSLGAVVLSVVFFPLFLFVVRWFNTEWIPVVLLGLVIFLLVQTTFGFLFFFAAGLIGWFVFSFPGLEQPLLAMLTGFFGTSTLLLSLSQSSIPKQKNDSFNAPLSVVIPGQVAGFLTAVIPGLGAAAAASLISPFVKLTKESFLVLVGAIGTVNFVLSLTTWYVLDRARNGAVIAIQSFTEPSLAVLLLGLGALLLAAGLSSLVLLPLARSATLLTKIPYTALIISIIMFLVLIVVFFSSWKGLLVLLVTTCLGVCAQKAGVPRLYLMGCIVVPVLIYVW